MGRTVGRGSRIARGLARRQRARRLALASASAAAALASEAARLRVESEALGAQLRAESEALAAQLRAESGALAGQLRTGSAVLAGQVRTESAALAARLAPVVEEARRTVAVAEARVRPAIPDARPTILEARPAEAAQRLEALVADTGRLADRATALADRVRRATAEATAAIGAGATLPVPRRPARGPVPSAPSLSTPTAPSLDDAPGLGPLALGLGAAQACFAATFRGPRARFWDRMTLTGLALGGYALAVRPSLRGTRIRPSHVVAGAASAAVLYGTFAVGDRLARRIVPSAPGDIAEIYALRDLRPRGEIALRLVTVIGPAEELFWRGLVQGALMARFGRWPGAAMAAAAYGGVHVVTGNFTLFGAAGIAGTHWCALYAAGVPLGALIVSHQLWDVWIFLLQPTSEVAPRAID